MFRKAEIINAEFLPASRYNMQGNRLLWYNYNITANNNNNNNNKIQTHKRSKRTLFIRTRQNQQIFGVISFVQLQNDTLTTAKLSKTKKMK